MKSKKIEDCGLASLQSSASVAVGVATTDTHNVTQLDNELQERFTPKRYQVSQLESDYYVLASLDPGYLKHLKRVSECGTYLNFGVTAEGKFKLQAANFCKDVMCPMCNWRRSLKMFGEVSACVNILQADYDFIFATFTIKNCSADALKNTCDTLQKSLSKMLRIKDVKSVVKGCFWALEITYNALDDEYHPHLHCIFAVDKTYFNNRHSWISQKQWSLYWQSALGVDYIPIVFIKKIIGDLTKAVAETAKYSVKGIDYLGRPMVLKRICDAITNRKKCSFRGVFSMARKKLGLNTDISDDLVHDETEPIRIDIYTHFISCHWNGGKYITSAYDEFIF